MNNEDGPRTQAKKAYLTGFQEGFMAGLFYDKTEKGGYNEMVLAEGIAVSGEYVSNLEDKRFVVIGKPYYETYKDQNSGKEEKKVVMEIELSDKAKLEYSPNKTSLKTMANHQGMEMDKWVGKVFKFKVMDQNVAGTDRKVLYVVDEKQ